MTWPRLAGVILTLLALAGCAQRFDDGRGPWHHGQIVIGTGNTTGVFYQVGGGLADVITTHLPGYEATVAPTAGSADNLLRLEAGDVDVALTFADVATDAIRGVGAFAGRPQRIRAIASTHRNYAHLIVRGDGRINSIADLRGKRISTGTRNSGTEFLALRLLRAAQIDPDRDVARQAMSLPATTRGLRDGSLDATFWTGGLPTVGITELLTGAPGRFRFLSVSSLLEPLDAQFPETYGPATIPAAIYRQPVDVPTLAVANLIVVSEDFPDDLARSLTELIFGFQEELVKAHPEWRNVRVEAASRTGAVPLHAGAARFYRGG